MNEDKTRKNVLFAVWYHSPSNKYTGNIEICLQYGGVQVNIQFAICHGCSYLLLVTMSCSINLFCANLQVHKDINCGYSQT